MNMNKNDKLLDILNKIDTVKKEIYDMMYSFDKLDESPVMEDNEYINRLNSEIMRWRGEINIDGDNPGMPNDIVSGMRVYSRQHDSFGIIFNGNDIGNGSNSDFLVCFLDDNVGLHDASMRALHRFYWYSRLSFSDLVFLDGI